MSSLFRDLNNAAVDAKLNKNEFLIFSVLMSQTLGFGKCSDPLTDARIAADTGIRLDRVRPALKSFLKRDIFQRRPHDQYQYEYYIADRFLDQADNEKVYTPHCAKSGEPQQDLTTNGGEQPTKRGHTTTNQTNIQKTPPPQTTETEIHKTPPPQDQQDAVVEIFMAGLEQMPEQFVVTSSQAVRIEFSTQNIGNVAVAQTTPAAANAVTTPTEHIIIEEEIHTTALETAPDTPTHIEPEPEHKADSKQVVTTNHDQHETSQTTEKPVVVVEKKVSEAKPQSNTPAKPAKVPNAVGEVNLNACNRQFKPLTKQQQDRVLLVFYAMLKTGTIRRPANYFIGLCRLAKTDDLTIPVEVQAQQPRSKKQIAALEEEQKRRDLWSDYVCIQRFAQADNESEAVVAERMGMEEAYAMYGQMKQAA